MRIVFTGGEHAAGLAAARGLRRAGHEPYAALGDDNSYASHSRAVTGARLVPQPRNDPAGFAHAVADYARDVGAHVVLPGVDAALVALAAHSDLFSDLRLGAPALSVVERATDKSLLQELAHEAGLSVPRTVVVAREVIEREAEQLGYPVVAKPIRSDVDVGGDRRVHVAPFVVRSPAELDAALAATPGGEWLLQPFLDATLGAIAGVAWDGSVVCAVHQRATRIWPPDCGISSYAQTVARDVALEHGLARVIERIGWSGIFQAQFLHTSDGALLIDFNPRFYGSLALAIGAGLNLPAIWVELLTGKTPNVGEYRVGVRYRTEEGDLRALLHAGPTAALRGLLPRPRTVHPIFQLRDPGPLAVSLRKLARR